MSLLTKPQLDNTLHARSAQRGEADGKSPTRKRLKYGITSRFTELKITGYVVFVTLNRMV